MVVEFIIGSTISNPNIYIYGNEKCNLGFFISFCKCLSYTYCIYSSKCVLFSQSQSILTMKISKYLKKGNSIKKKKSCLDECPSLEACIT